MIPAKTPNPHRSHGSPKIRTLRLESDVVYSPPKQLTFEQFLEEYGGNPDYELVNGEVIPMDPTGPHEIVIANLLMKLVMAIAQTGKPWRPLQNCPVKPFLDRDTARRPDLAIVDAAALSKDPSWQKQAALLNPKPIKLAIEVVSTNWQTDYIQKVEEYAIFGIAEYWIVDFRGLGGIEYIGTPKQPTFIVATLHDNQYHQTQYRLGQAIESPLFPELKLRLDDITEPPID